MAGGCFYGIQSYFSKVKGVESAICGYANGTVPFPSFEDVLSGETGHAMAVKIDFEENLVPLSSLIEHYLRLVDPYSCNRQKEYKGPCYRLGIYYVDILDGIAITHYIDTHVKPGNYVEVKRFDNFYPAEEKHQNYAKTHPFWQNSVDLSLLKPWERK